MTLEQLAEIEAEVERRVAAWKTQLQMEADASERRALKHERSLIAEELFAVLTALGIGPNRRHSPEVVYTPEDRKTIGNAVLDVIYEASVRAIDRSAWDMEEK